MTTEYRPLLTADAVIAARDAGEVVEFTSTECEFGWLEPNHINESDATESIARFFGYGCRYRARPAGESDDFVKLWHGGRPAEEDSRMVEFVEAGMRSGRSPADPIDPNEKFLVTDVHCCCGNVVRVLHDTCQRAKNAELDTLRANHEELVRQFHAMEDERNAAEARAARLEAGIAKLVEKWRAEAAALKAEARRQRDSGVVGVMRAAVDNANDAATAESFADELAALGPGGGA